MVIKTFTKEEFSNIIKSINVPRGLDEEYFYSLYLTINDGIKEVIHANENYRFTPVNPIALLFYIVNEYQFATQNLPIEKIEEIKKQDDFFNGLVSICADKYFTNEQLNYKSHSFLNKFNPQVSTLELYLNFALQSLNTIKSSNQNDVLVINMLKKAFTLSKCILNLLIDGSETEAFSTWRTLHENECILICLNKYGDKMFKSYFKHIKYALAYRGQIKSKEETDKVFEQIKSEMKSYELKSKDMKKYIEYGYLFSIDGIKLNEDFKLNFRDGIQKMAGLSSYSKTYEMSSEISHSSPLLLFSNKQYYFVITLLNLYDSFFRLEKIFNEYYLKCANELKFIHYNQLKKTYMTQLIIIYKQMQNNLLKLKRKDSE